MPPLSDRLAELARITERAVDVALRGRQVLQVALKGDNSIVTNVDKEVETYLRAELSKAWPGTTFWGEEFGRDADASTEKGLWLIDPIDGTSNFAYGSQLWGISIGLMVGDKVELGAVALPDLKELYLAEAGQGASCNREALAPIPPGPIKSHELVSYHDGILRDYIAHKMPGKMRCSGAFVVDGTFTARQRYRGLIGKGEYLYDAAGSMVLCSEVGADIRYADGSPLDWDALAGGKRFGNAWIMFPRESGLILSKPV